MKTNKKDQRGITHHLMLVGLAVVVLGAIGFAGFRIYKNNDTKAKAAYYKNFPVIANLSVNACRVSGVGYRYYVLNRTNYTVKDGFNNTIKPNSNGSVIAVGEGSTIVASLKTSTGSYLGGVPSWKVSSYYC